MPSPSLEIFHPSTRKWFSETLGAPTPVQEAAWPAIAAGGHALVSAPTGTGKTLSAFLVFIDRLKAEARSGSLKKELRLIYISPLKALAGDIRENLHRPLYGIREDNGFANEIRVAVRTGDTPGYERQKMVKNPPHILITTPESLYLLLTSVSGRGMLKTARAVIIDELHALIDAKRGAHLTLSLARLDKLCGKPLQRVGLSATIQPLPVAAEYLAGDGSPVTIAAPNMKKAIRIEVNAPVENMRLLPQGNIWPELARAVYEQCYGARSVIVFTDGRMYAERLAYHINQLAGENFSRTHHGCVSREQRQEAEEDLRSGNLRLLVATSSMELGIDVGEIDKVIQIAYPKSVSSLLQRLGRAGHNPGRVSVMHLYPRTQAEGLYCGLTASVASEGGIEKLRPPRLCLDVLAQHLVSMSAVESYTEEDVLALTSRAYPFSEITVEDIKSVLRMLAGDYEHARDLPARPRILYDRIHGRAEGDAYSRMLAVSAGGTIPDTGQFAVKTENNVKIGELDEEFVFEARVGDKFTLGAFAWKISAMDKDAVFVAQSTPEGAQPPFWRNARASRRLSTGLAFGKKMREMTGAGNRDGIIKILRGMGLDEAMADNTAGVILRQLEATGALPDDRTVIAEHFRDKAGDRQVMIHSVYGKQVNAPLAILLQEAAQRITGTDVSVFDDDDGVLLMARGGRELPEGLLKTILPSTARGILEAALPATPLFNMAFRYNAGRALMMGVRSGKRNPLWVQRLRASEMLNAVIRDDNHPLIRETKRECAEDYWDLPGLITVLAQIQSGSIALRELRLEEPSPMSLPLRREAESAFMYNYFPGTRNIGEAAAQALKDVQKLKPASEQLARASERKKRPEDEKQLHSLLMTEGDVMAEEINAPPEYVQGRNAGPTPPGFIPVPAEWFENLAAQGRALYIEPGLWIAAEHRDLYEAALCSPTDDTANAVPCPARKTVVRRMLRYRGAHSAATLAERYRWTVDEAAQVLASLEASGEAVADGGVYYHADLYEYARRETVAARRGQIKTQPPQAYAALIAHRLRVSAPPGEQLSAAFASLRGSAFPPALWEGALLPARVRHYRAAMLDALLSEGEWFWKLREDGGAFALEFLPAADMDWDYDLSGAAETLTGGERRVYEILRKRGASFITALETAASSEEPVYDILVSLMEKGLVYSDSFTPVRNWLDKGKIQKRSVKRRVGARVRTMTAGRWDLVRPVKTPSLEQEITRAFAQWVVLCRETAAASGLNWALALSVLRVWEYTGRARRGYFVEGLSGAQFIREEDYAAAVPALENPPDNTVWLAASDPAQTWGKFFPHDAGRAFLCVPGTAAALRKGAPVAAFERYGQALRVFDGESLPRALRLFMEEYTEKRLFPEKKRLTVKQYPAEAAQALSEAGFVKVMMDFAAYQG
ncbi:MAG: DEAD/DEAH box helicase [Clostridiales bacterium]|jgi:ATP-dependent Lhr-like helicase|nr:DEAD/DEAH box helicase [Clostridiales bacterium]